MEKYKEYTDIVRGNISLRAYTFVDGDMSVTIHKVYSKGRSAPEYNPLKGDLADIVACIEEYHKAYPVSG